MSILSPRFAKGWANRQLSDKTVVSMVTSFPESIFAAVCLSPLGSLVPN